MVVVNGSSGQHTRGHQSEQVGIDAAAAPNTQEGRFTSAEEVAEAELEVISEQEPVRPSHPWTRYVALGDSFTEGIGDPDETRPGYHRGWADRVAETLAEAPRTSPMRTWRCAES